MKKTALFLLLTFFVAACGSGGAKKPSAPKPEKAMRVTASADEKLRSGKIRGAKRKYKAALAGLQKTDDLKNSAIVYHKLGKLGLVENDLAAARLYIKSAKVIAVREGYGDLLAAIALSEASLLTAEGKPEEAEKILGEFNATKTGAMENAKGRVAMAVSDMDSAKKYFESALKISLSNGDLSTESAARANLGFLLIKTGNPDSAIEQLKGALRIDKKTETVLSIGSTLHLLGMAYEASGDYKTALYYYNRALNSDRQTRIAIRIKADKNAVDRMEKNLNP